MKVKHIKYTNISLNASAMPTIAFVRNRPALADDICVGDVIAIPRGMEATGTVTKARISTSSCVQAWYTTTANTSWVPHS